ncbi:MAG: hypothetical protein LBF88_11090 [Planctomycetaceae bacterium]|nr:hypothetical protein [Planctomycetaceae bacterium]
MKKRVVGDVSPKHHVGSRRRGLWVKGRLPIEGCLPDIDQTTPKKDETIRNFF